jgi:hypothetical protein
MRILKSTVIIAALLATSLSYANDQDLDETDFASTSASVFKIDDNNSYSDNLALREARKIGLGFEAGGVLGLYGFNIEINFEDENGAIAGVGGGDGYNSVHMAWKHVFLGDTIAPYTTAGYAHWYNTGGGNFRNSSVLDRVLTDAEKNTGKFSADFLTGSLGLQFVQLNGRYAGASLFAEITLLGDIERPTIVPTGAVGAGYYF